MWNIKKTLWGILSSNQKNEIKINSETIYCHDRLCHTHTHKKEGWTERKRKHISREIYYTPSFFHRSLETLLKKTERKWRRIGKEDVDGTLRRRKRISLSWRRNTASKQNQMSNCSLLIKRKITGGKKRAKKIKRIRLQMSTDVVNCIHIQIGVGGLRIETKLASQRLKSFLLQTPASKFVNRVRHRLPRSCQTL